MKVLTKMRFVAPLVVAAALALAACGSSSKNSSSGSPSSSSSAPAQTGSSGTVSAKKVGNLGTVLVDSSMGMTVYTPDQEANGKILCTGECTSFWQPVMAGSATPTAGPGVTGTLGVAMRPDGARQVTINGKPLYMFVEDKGAGGTAGNNFKDSFSGHDFTWHAVKADGSLVGSSSMSSGGTGGGSGGGSSTTSTTSSSGGGGYGGGY